MAEAFRQRLPEEEPSPETLDSFTTIIAVLILKQIQKTNPEFRDQIDPELVFRKAAEIPLKPANNRMSEDDMRELVSSGNWITNAAEELIAAHLNGQST